jgi:hypothetical protein
MTMEGLFLVNAIGLAALVLSFSIREVLGRSSGRTISIFYPNLYPRYATKRY